MVHAERKRLPAKRRSWRQEVSIAGHTFLLTGSEYEDGRLGEIFIDGNYDALPELKSAMSLLAISVSIGLQHGVPLDEYVEAFVHTKFPPEGMVWGSDKVRFTTSPADWVFRELAIIYLNRIELASGGGQIMETSEPEESEDGQVEE